MAVGDVVSKDGDAAQEIGPTYPPAKIAVGWSIDSVSGEPVPNKSTNGAADVTTMPGGITNISESITLTTGGETFDFSANPIKAATVIISPAVNTFTVPNNSAVICIDPPNAAYRDLVLTAADAFSGGSKRIPVLLDYPFEMVFSSPVSFIGAKMDVGTTAELRMTIIGVEA